ncbi:peptidase family M1-domain-containing protein [Boletus coccyginus]|nr:peptidase family M1-domain-containing protein [Boletus coccyginus]
MSDPTTQSNYDVIATTDVELDWRVDFDIQTISGSALHRLKVLAEDGVDTVVFDTSDLEVERVEVKIGGKASWEGVQFSIGKAHPVMGSALSVPLGRVVDARHNDTLQGGVCVRVTYKTKNSKALQWLDPQQTQGKTHPYLFSQCQPIYARALVPIQDTPSVKIRYTARVTSTLPVLMSAVRTAPCLEDFPRKSDLGKKLVTYEYNQPAPIPSYLLAIASGSVVYRAFQVPKGKTWTSGVWAESELVDAAWYEFNEDTPRFLAAEEEITIDYKFGVYDLLVLPPAFPYGGMENACLTFVTPTLLTGDRSLVDVVVHEITHSWFGNGVTQANASHFWLNEGWTTYIERVLQQRLHTPAHRGFSFLIGRKGLDDDLARYADLPRYQRLQIDFEKGEDPDDAYSDVPYEKGANFLLHLERTLGGLDVFLPYVKHYVQRFMGQSITTQQWKDDLVAYFKENEAASKALGEVLWDEWLFGEGLTLPVPVEYDTTLATASYALASRWDKSRSTDVSKLDFGLADLAGMDTNQIIVFLERLESELIPPLPHTHIDHLGSVYALTHTLNVELRLRFYQVALRDPTSSTARAYAAPAALWVVGADETGVVKGRMKFCRPVFRAVASVDWEMAVRTYQRYREAFHPIARSLIEKVRVCACVVGCPG